MSWQKCPICDGTGQMTGNYVACTAITCPTCRGYRIISEITGLPPEYEMIKRAEEMEEFGKLANKVFKPEVPKITFEYEKRFEEMQKKQDEIKSKKP